MCLCINEVKTILDGMKERGQERKMKYVFSRETWTHL